MPYALKNRKVLVTGGSRGLGAVIARKFAEEGCAVAINYSSNVEAAENTVMSIEKDCGVKCIALKGDMGKLVDCVDVVQEAIKQLRGLDILISNAGWTKFSRFGDLDALSEEDWDKCWSVNVKGPMFLLREALPTFNANTDGGVFLMTSSIAGVGTSGSTMAYAVSKAAGLHLMQCLTFTQGPKVRINAVLPGLLLTDWGAGFGEDRITMTKNKALLKKETDLEDCAEAFVMLAKNSSMTGQKVQVGLCPAPSW